MIRIIYLIKKEKRSTFFNATPVPLATACKGFQQCGKVC